MGLLEQFTQAAGGMLGNNPQGSPQQQGSSPLLKILGQMLNSQSGSGGGLMGMVQGFQKNGLGEVITSWVSTGKNIPVSPEQIKQGLGSDAVQQIAQQCGSSPEQTSAELSKVLPDLVDKLTPEGQVPESGELDAVFAFLASKFK